MNDQDPKIQAIHTELERVQESLHPSLKANMRPVLQWIEEYSIRNVDRLPAVTDTEEFRRVLFDLVDEAFKQRSTVMDRFGRRI